MFNGWIIKNYEVYEFSPIDSTVFVTWRNLTSNKEVIDMLDGKAYTLIYNLAVEQREHYFGGERQGGMTTQEGASG